MPITANTNTNAPFTQNSAMHEIVGWSESRPNWQREALKHLAAGTPTNEIDLDRLEAICVGEIADFDPLTFNDVGLQSSSSEAVAILSVNSVVGVNALASDQSLDIAKTGITIVYGDNGSGKSGYCRVLKNACRTRDEKFTILSNIDDAKESVQSALIEFADGSNDKTLAWSPEAAQEAALAKVGSVAFFAHGQTQASDRTQLSSESRKLLESGLSRGSELLLSDHVSDLDTH